jgi:hypothetical protein
LRYEELRVDAITHGVVKHENICDFALVQSEGMMSLINSAYIAPVTSKLKKSVISEIGKIIGQMARAKSAKI